ncbi:urease accessory protein UreF [Granulicella cerasi]|uniref:Urease accessory protein UreF n=1 Tax=Granulicella cerasi TaxID=741063 RepID=A0ABW1ZBU9_9BACT|nr:urease accessory UreF family protein [Granulicella cerasi]
MAELSMGQAPGVDRSMMAWLQLLQLSDSALPIGALSHSFGVESLVAEGGLDTADLPRFYAEWLAGAGHADAVLCAMAHAVDSPGAWQQLNAMASAMRPARESRDASTRLGRRFLGLAAQLENDERLRYPGDGHLAAAFGLVAAVLGIGAAEAAGAYLHQTLFGSVSACQRLLPLGQTVAMQLLWSMKPRMMAVIEQACAAPQWETLWNLQPALEVASMRHPQLHTRLFIS